MRSGGQELVVMSFIEGVPRADVSFLEGFGVSAPSCIRSITLYKLRLSLKPFIIKPFGLLSHLDY